LGVKKGRLVGRTRGGEPAWEKWPGFRPGRTRVEATSRIAVARAKKWETNKQTL